MKTKLLLDSITSLPLIFSLKITMVFMENEASPSPLYEILLIAKIICSILAVSYLNHGITIFLFSENEQCSIDDSVSDPPFAYDPFIKRSDKTDVWENEEIRTNFPFSSFFSKKYFIQSLKSLHNKTFIYEKVCSFFILNFLSYGVAALVFSTVDR